MIIEIAVRKTQICLCRRGVYFSLVASPMEYAQALALAPQYGFRADEVAMVRPIEMLHRRYLDDDALRAVLRRYPFNPNRTQQEMLDIVRRHFDSRAVRIISSMIRPSALTMSLNQMQ